MDAKRPHIVIRKEIPPTKIRTYNGGGSSFKRTDRVDHAQSIKKNSEQLRAYFAKTKDASINSKLYLKVKFDESVKVSGSFEETIKENLFGRIVSSPNDQTAHISIPKDSYKDLADNLKKYSESQGEDGRSKFAVLEEFGQIPFEEKASLRVLQTEETKQEEFLINLHDDLSIKEIESIIKEFQTASNGTDFTFIDSFESAEGTVITVKGQKKKVKELSEDYISIQSIDINDEIMVTQSIAGEAINDTTQILPNTSNAKVCIVDKGINNTSRLLAGSILGVLNPFDKKGIYPVDRDRNHGTFVASKIIFGDEIKEQYANQSFDPSAKVFVLDIRKFSDIGNPEAAKVNDLVRVIRKFVKDNHTDIRVYNLSIACVKGKSSSSVIDDSEIHKLAAELDYLSREYDVLFVVSAGNYPLAGDNFSLTSPYGSSFSIADARILPPSDSVLCLTVGSIAKNIHANSMAKKYDPSPFTRVGPGYKNYMKPDVVAHGGNLLNNHVHFNDISSVGIHGDGSSLAYGNGTSYSAPLISRFAAKIFEQMPWAYSCLVKAIVIHVSNNKICSGKHENQDRLIGSGMPDWLKAFDSSPTSQTYYHQGEMKYREMIEIPFFVPSCLLNRTVQKKQKKLRIKVTITFSPETRKSLRNGYCKSHIRTKILKLDSKGRKKDVAFAKSTTIVSDRYSTVVQMEAEFDRGVHGDWSVFIAHESRWELKNPMTKFAVVITIEDPLNSPGIDIFAGIRNEAKNRYQETINIQNVIKV